MLLTKDELKEMEYNNTSYKILIADDDLSTRMLLCAAIQQWGYRVIEVSNGDEAWAALNSDEPPTLLILDWLMPKMDGIELIMKIKHELSFDCYIILLSQMNGNLNAVRALEAGADEFLTKPFNMGELKIRLNAGSLMLYYKNTIKIQNHLLQLCYLNMLFSHSHDKSEDLILNHFDMNRLYDVFGDDYAKIDNFIKTFISSALKHTNEIQESINNNEIQKAKNIVHQLKGSSGNSGATSIYKLSIKLEDALQENNINTCSSILEKIRSILIKFNFENITIKSKEIFVDNKNNSILIVDDNIINLKLTKVVLKNDGFNVMTAANANEAMAIVNQYHPSLVIMDLQIPGMDGLELTRIIKANPKTRHIIVVALTANAMTGDKEKALSSGCDAYITKPFDTKMFPKTISDLLHKGCRDL